MCSLEKQGSVFVLTLTGPGEHRLNPTLIAQIRLLLGRVRAESLSLSSTLVTTAEGKFFSNGYDLDWAVQSPETRGPELDSALRFLVADLAALPMPTIAAVTGHASAAGMILALAHDYVAMRKDRGFLYMSELDIRLKIPTWFVALIKSRIGAPAVRRRLLLTAAKVTASEAMESGFVDSVHDGAAPTVDAAVALGERLATRGWDGEVYAQIRSELLAEVLAEICSDRNPVVSKL